VSYYDILGVKSDAPISEIKKKYRKLSRQYHPDLNPDNPAAEEKFKEISEAYNTLSDKGRRQEYDMRTSYRSTPPGGFAGFSGPAGFQAIFDQFFGGRPNPMHRPPPPRRPKKKEPPSVNFKIPIEKLTKEPEVKSYFSLKKETICQECSGIGAEFVEACQECEGSGMMEVVKTSGNMVITSTLPCNDCRGTGKKLVNPCEPCSGAGVKETVQRYEVKMRCKEVK